MNVAGLVQSVSEAIGHLTATASDELVGFAKGNITEHVATLLLSTPHSRSVVVEAIDLWAGHVKLPLAAANAAEHCAWAALANLTNIADISSRNPLDYVPSTYDGVKRCLYEEAARHHTSLNWLLALLLLVIIMTLLFGPYWAVLIPLRMMGFGAVGVEAATIAAMLQAALYGRYTPAGGWFATLTRWGMTLVW